MTEPPKPNSLSSGASQEYPNITVERNVTFVVRDGQPLTGTWYSPPGDGPFPAVVAVHGGGWRLASTDNYQHLGPWLARNGYAVFAPTYRIAKPGRETFPDAVQDVRAAVQFVKERSRDLRIFADRVALMGDSAGAHLAALVALAGDDPFFRDGNTPEAFGRISTKVKVAIPVYGIYDLAQQWRHDQLTRPLEHIVELFLGKSLIADRRVYFDASPLSYVSPNNNSTAFLVAWGTEDDIVDPKTQGQAFVEALKQAKFYVRTVIAQGAPHYWISEPFDEPGSYSAFFAHRLLRFLRARL